LALLGLGSLSSDGREQAEAFSKRVEFLLPLPDYMGEGAPEFQKTHFPGLDNKKAIFISTDYELGLASFKESCVWNPKLTTTYLFIRSKQML